MEQSNRLIVKKSGSAFQLNSTVPMTLTQLGMTDYPSR